MCAGNGTVNETATTDGDYSICHGTQHTENVTWYIDFTTLKSIYRIAISGEVTYETPSGHLSVYISNSSSWTTGFLCAKLKKNINKQLTLNTTCAKHGRYVVIHFEGNSDLIQSGKSPRTKSDWFFICEIKIEGCDAGVFGENCNKNCSRHCIGKNCDILDGRCLSTMCSDGWQGNSCSKRCSNRTYGHQCQSTCGKCANLRDCHHLTGNCAEGCVDGWEGNKCDKGIM
ncbi:uncharacterized protein LOC134254860 [Saccostrea cucullata]|uniref:uncharacterized protein LOC134254860 n=1 Tax=Saccostrea cuccullata TaxID=36930 RepID=UPI002ED2E2DF